MQKKPCCPASAMRNERQIIVSGNLIGLVDLDTSLQEKYEMSMPGEKQIRKELVERVKLFHHVVPGVENQYEDALYEVYPPHCRKRSEEE